MKAADRVEFWIIILGAIIATLIVLAVIGYMSGGWEADAQTTLPSSKYDQRLFELQREAIDNAYRHKIEALFTIWLSDPSGQPGRAITGARNARRAYIDVMTAIERNEAERQR